MKYLHGGAPSTCGWVNINSMKPRSFLAMFAYAAALSLPAQMQHHHGMEAAPPEALAKVGKVKMPISCSEAAQVPFERGVAMLHSFWYEEARKQFLAVAKADPGCAMGQWGLAMTEWRPFWDGMPEQRRRAGVAEIERAATVARTDRERRYIAALSGYMHAKPDGNAGAAQVYADAMEALHRAYPSDVEAQAFYGLSLAVAAGFAKDSIAGDRKALAVLQPGFEAHPEHPGFAHYIIHTCDNPQLAREALPAAERYAAIAPASAHALHMPGHIFARLGMWPQDIAVNRDSVRASELAEKEHLDGAAHVMHAYEFLLYAYLQDGEDAEALRIESMIDSLVRHLAAVPGIQKDGMYVFTSYAQVEFPSIYHLERQEWKEVLAIREPADALKSSSYFLAWAKAIAAGHLRDASAADQASARAQELYQAVAQEGSPIAAEEHATFLTIQGWQSWAHHKDADGLAKLSAAADEQDRVGQAEVDLPAREMYAGMLLAEGRAVEALAQYKVDLGLSPNRLDGLAGAARAAKAAGEVEEALGFDRQLLRITHGGSESTRPQVAEAREEVRS